MSSNKYYIEVVKHSSCKDSQYCARPSPLGNPYPISKHHSRDEVCKKYEEWFNEQIENNNKLVIHELIRLHGIGRINGVIRLGCFCAPKRCHGETIRDFMMRNQDLLEEWYLQVHSKSRHEVKQC